MSAKSEMEGRHDPVLVMLLIMPLPHTRVIPSSIHSTRLTQAQPHNAYAVRDVQCTYAGTGATGTGAGRRPPTCCRWAARPQRRSCLRSLQTARQYIVTARVKAESNECLRLRHPHHRLLLLLLLLAAWVHNSVSIIHTTFFEVGRIIVIPCCCSI